MRASSCHSDFCRDVVWWRQQAYQHDLCSTDSLFLYDFTWNSWSWFLHLGLEQAFLHPPLVYIFWIHSSSLRQFLDFSWKCAHPQPSHLSYSHSFPLGANLDSHILYLQSYVKLGSIEHSYNPGNQRLRQEDCEFKTALGNKWWDSCQSVK